MKKLISLLLIFELLVIPVKEILAGNHNGGSDSEDSNVSEMTQQHGDSDSEDSNVSEMTQQLCQAVEELRQKEAKQLEWCEHQREEAARLRNQLHEIEPQHLKNRDSFSEHVLQIYQRLEEMSGLCQKNSDKIEASSKLVSQRRCELEQFEQELEGAWNQMSKIGNRSSCNVC
jgi:chromosome segregation ATPase